MYTNSRTFELYLNDFAGLDDLEFITLKGNIGLTQLPQGLFSETCSLKSLDVEEVDIAAFDNNVFAGWPNCGGIIGNPELRELCEAQQDVYVEGSCNDQACRTGTCSACASESWCGSYGWCTWLGGSCSVPDCEAGKQPNAENDGCEPCEAGKYSNTDSNAECALCEAGLYSVVVGSVSSGDCEMCEAGKVSSTDGAACIAATGVAATADHAWDFRGCVDDVPVVDSAGGLGATLENGAACSADGVAFDGEDDYVELEPWEFGGAMALEVYVKYESFQSWSVVFGCGSSPGLNNVYLANTETSSEVFFSARLVANGAHFHTERHWEVGTWQHVVITVSGSTMKAYKDGELVAEKTDGWEPNTATRANSFLGRSNWPSDGYFHGSIGFVRTWHGVELGQEEITALFNERAL